MERLRKPFNFILGIFEKIDQPSGIVGLGVGLIGEAGLWLTFPSADKSVALGLGGVGFFFLVLGPIFKISKPIKANQSDSLNIQDFVGKTITTEELEKIKPGVTSLAFVWCSKSGENHSKKMFIPSTSA
jgi:hypothetical protein